MRRPLTLCITLAAIVGIGAALALRPGDLERIAMLQRDGETEAATRLANRLYEAGDRRASLLARVFELNHAIGRAQRAGEALRLYLAGTPDNRHTLAKAADFFELEQDLEGTFAAMVNLVRVAPSAGTVDKLARLYRLHGRFEQEERLLSAHRPLLGAEMSMRLGALLAQHGRTAEALVVLRAADDAFPRDHELFASLLFDLLAKAGAADEAVRRASRWLANDQEGHRRVPMVVALIEAGAEAAALRIAFAPAGATPAEPDAPLSAVIWALASRGYVEPAGALVEHLTDCRGSGAGRAAVRAYLDFASTTGATAGLIARIDRLVTAQERGSRVRGLCLAAHLLDRDGLAALGPVRRRLTPFLLAEDPVFAAELAMAEGQPLAARSHLALASLSDKDEQGAKEWLLLAREAFSPAELARELASRRMAGTLPSALIPALQASMRQAGLGLPDFDPVSGQGEAP